MSTLRIAQVAHRTGIPTTTLRYYEEIGLLAPAKRAFNGYRVYTERDVERLQFITRAKNLHISLEELRDLVAAWDGDDCATVQFRMADVVALRLRETQARIAELLELADHLHAASNRLAAMPTDGGCSDGCACTTAAACAPTRSDLTLSPTRRMK